MNDTTDANTAGKIPRQTTLDALNIALLNTAHSLGLLGDPTVDRSLPSIFNGQPVFQIVVIAGTLDVGREDEFEGLSINMVDAELDPFTVEISSDGCLTISTEGQQYLTLEAMHLQFILAAQRMALPLLREISAAFWAAEEQDDLPQAADTLDAD